jgi:hypothetical protein
MWDLSLSEPFRTALASSRIMNPGRLPRGAIVAVAWLAGCEPTDNLVQARSLFLPSTGAEGHPQFWGLTTKERAFGDYTPKRFAWPLADVRYLPEPIPYRGMLGLWAVPAELEARIEEAS